MDQLVCASPSHTHCGYEVGMLKVMAECIYQCMYFAGTFSNHEQDCQPYPVDPYSCYIRWQGDIVSTNSVRILCRHTRLGTPDIRTRNQHYSIRDLFSRVLP